MAAPSINFLRDIISPSILRVDAEPIKKSSTPAAVYRLLLVFKDQKQPQSMVFKRIQEDWPDDPQGHRREPEIDVPHPEIYFAGPEPRATTHLVLMEDATPNHWFPSPSHAWSQKEIELIIRSYARLHASGISGLETMGETDWLVERHEKRLYDTADQLPVMLEALIASGTLPKISGFGSLLQQTLRDAERLADQPVTVIHNDVYPPNCGIPLDGVSDVILVDWDMVGTGLAEMDLAFMFMQPFKSSSRLNRKAALNYYWEQRKRFEGAIPTDAERIVRQRYADTLWALWLIPVAYRMWASPFPPKSPPRIYWDSMFGVLGERLQALADET